MLMQEEYVMEKFIKKIYLRELVLQANNAIHSDIKMKEALENRSNEDFFREAEHFLQHAAAIS